MTPALNRLIGIVTLEQREPDRFRGVGSTADGVDGTFGGHFLGQAVAAASATVDGERRLHSLHAYFLRGGRPGTPFDLEVERVRDGRTFCSRRVRTTQDGGPVQFELLASFTRPEDGPELCPDPPFDPAELPPPTSLPRYGDLMASLDPLPLPESWALRQYGLDLRTLHAPWVRSGPSPTGGIRLWVRAEHDEQAEGGSGVGGDPGLPDDPALHLALLAYQSDESLADTVAMPWGVTWGTPGVAFVSLDHAGWIHRPLDLNRWHILDQRPISVARGRGLATASLWDDEGRLVATFNQEALLRLPIDLDPDHEAHHG